MKRSMKNARERAKIVADVIGKKTGEILVIADYTLEEKPESAYYPDGERSYRIVVRFAIK